MSEDSTHQEWLVELIKKRRTRKPIYFDGKVPSERIEHLIDVARNAPNHHRTEPARFYILDCERIRKVAKLFNEVISGDSIDPALVKKGLRKEKEWGNSTGLLVITSYTDENSLLLRKNPNVVQENYATTCCTIQNLLLLFESNNISAKWSTGPVWEHPSFSCTIGIEDPKKEKVVALLFYGFSSLKAEIRTLSPLKNFIVNHSKS
jgi:nitroreductase